MAGQTALRIPALIIAALIAAPAQAVPTGHSTNYGDWVVECRVTGSGQDCNMNQRIIDGRTQTQLVQFQVTAGQTPQVRLLVPLGVWIDPGIAIRIDAEKEVYSFTYAKCVPEGCLADGPLTPKLLAALQGGREGTILVADRHRKVVSVPFSPQGFGEAFQALKAETEPKTDWWVKLQADIKAQIDKLMDGKS